MTLFNKKTQYAILSLLTFTSLSLGLTTPAFAIPSDRNQAISLEADRATFNEKTGITTYTGNVVIQQGTLKIQANSIVANLNQQSQIKNVTAQGAPAKFQQQMDTKGGLAKGEAKKIIYNAETGILSLSGGAFLSQNGATFRGENLTYSMNKGDIEATGGSNGRIKIVIPPTAQQSFPGARD